MNNKLDYFEKFVWTRFSFSYAYTAGNHKIPIEFLKVEHDRKTEPTVLLAKIKILKTNEIPIKDIPNVSVDQWIRLNDNN